MNKSDLKKFEKLLLEERERLLKSIRNIEETTRNESGRDNGGDLASFAEKGTDSFELDTALNIASNASERLMEINEALLRIKSGAFGTCEGSGKPIPKKRLEVFPAARYTVEYQEELERERTNQR